MSEAKVFKSRNLKKNQYKIKNIDMITIVNNLIKFLYKLAHDELNCRQTNEPN